MKMNESGLRGDGVRRHLGVPPNKLCFSYCLRLSVIGKLVIPPFTIFSNANDDDSSDYSNLREKSLF